MNTPALQDEVSAEALAILGELGLTHTEAARIVGMTKATFSRTINGHKLGNLTELGEVIAKVGGDPRRLIRVGAVSALPARLRWAVEQLRALDDDAQQRALRVIEAQTDSDDAPPDRTARQSRVRDLVDDADDATLDLVEAILVRVEQRKSERGQANGA